MKEWFELSNKDQLEIVTQTSVASGLPAAAIEKDWWVMIALRAVFNTEYAKHLVFKGGTSLSKAWNIIERFSEDIDLAIDRSFFNFEGDLSTTQVKKLRKASCKFVTEEFLAKLKISLNEQNIKNFELNIVEFEDSDADPVAIELKYKSITEKIEYLQPRILIEISSRSLREPFEVREIQSIIGANYQEQKFADKAVGIPSVLPSRTFLEKIFLLHEEFQKPENKKIKSERMTRHLYDIEKLMNTKFSEDAIKDKELYLSIVNHRKTITKLPWVDYTKHAPKTIDFIPPERIIEVWRKDYTAMQESMFYGKTETFDNLISKLEKLKTKINSIK